MPISRISKLSDCGVFGNFSWSQSLSDFAKYNLIYGWNGTGKTTLSKILRALELRTPLSSGKATLCIGGDEISDDHFSEIGYPIKVFNRDFIKESVFPADGSDVAPIFILGKENVEKQKEVDRLKQTRIRASAELVSARGQNQQNGKILDQYCQNQARLIKETLRSSGQNSFNNYNKSDFQNRAERMITDDDVNSYRLNETERESLRAQQKNVQKSNISEIMFGLPDFDQLTDSVSSILQKTVVSEVIQSLKDDAEYGDWVRKGLGLHQERHTIRCLFCEQKLPEDRLSNLEKHFSDDYEQLMRDINEKVETLKIFLSRITQLKTPSRAEFYDNIIGEYELAARSIHLSIEKIKAFVNSLIEALENKKTRPFDSMVLDTSGFKIDMGVFQQFNHIIRKHNKISEDFQTHIDSVRKQLALDLIASSIDEFIKLKNDVQKASSDLDIAKNTLNALDKDIANIEKDIIEHRKPAEELNKDLKAYLGHNELKLEVMNTGYAIMRKNERADSLSEGEITAIALLYFLKSLEDRRFDILNGTIILDDPVSSLDQNALFAAFGFIRARTKTAGQLIILAHNFTFFRLVRDWFCNLRGKDKRDWQIYMLQCQENANARESKLHDIDPMLMNYDSEYHYLFSQVYKIAYESSNTELEHHYGVPSIARRVLEMFLAFRVPTPGRNRLWSQMLEIGFDETKRSRVYRFLQMHSHRNAIGDADEDLTLLAESRLILKDLLNFMREADKDHFARMVKLTLPEKE